MASNEGLSTGGVDTLDNPQPQPSQEATTDGSPEVTAAGDSTPTTSSTPTDSGVNSNANSDANTNVSSTGSDSSSTGRACEKDQDCGLSNACLAFRCDEQKRCQQDPQKTALRSELQIGDQKIELALQNSCGGWQAGGQHSMPVEGCAASVITLRCFRDLQGLRARVEVQGEKCESKAWTGPSATRGCSAVTASGLPESVATITGQCCWP